MDHSTEPEVVHFTDVLSTSVNMLLEIITEHCQDGVCCRFPCEAAATTRIQPVGSQRDSLPVSSLKVCGPQCAQKHPYPVL